MSIRLANAADIDAIVKLHIIAFPGFFLTLLGAAFLRQLYVNFLNHPTGTLIVAYEQDRLLGFAAGTSSPDCFFSEIRGRQWFRFSLSALPAMVKHPFLVLRKLTTAIFYRGDPPSDLIGAALLSSIGVEPQVTGKSVGGKLLHEFEEHMRANGIGSVYLITDANDNEGVNAFYQKYGYRQENRFIQGGKRLMVRYLKNLNSTQESFK
jgi:ribosomal protein S18 acetylase RimI-like enzyme